MRAAAPPLALSTVIQRDRRADTAHRSADALHRIPLYMSGRSKAHYQGGSVMNRKACKTPSRDARSSAPLPSK